mmetsp:Transcript_29090/g.64262  ORF Transcript_29090/g.64262 Transcript_29090/m.64262 type:complete len:208 (+) Transcript_29090:1528-2151(+)
MRESSGDSTSWQKTRARAGMTDPPSLSRCATAWRRVGSRPSASSSESKISVTITSARAGSKASASSCASAAAAAARRALALLLPASSGIAVAAAGPGAPTQRSSDLLLTTLMMLDSPLADTTRSAMIAMGGNTSHAVTCGDTPPELDWPLLLPGATPCCSCCRCRAAIMASRPVPVPMSSTRWWGCRVFSSACWYAALRRRSWSISR